MLTTYKKWSLFYPMTPFPNQRPPVMRVSPRINSTSSSSWILKIGPSSGFEWVFGHQGHSDLYILFFSSQLGFLQDFLKVSPRDFIFSPSNVLCVPKFAFLLQQPSPALVKPAFRVPSYIMNEGNTSAWGPDRGLRPNASIGSRPFECIDPIPSQIRVAS